jgi:hypothetical protein
LQVLIKTLLEKDFTESDSHQHGDFFDLLSRMMMEVLIK